MERFEKIRYLNEILLDEMPEYRAQAAQFSQEEAAQRRLLRSLMNLRPPGPLKPRFLRVQDELLSAEREARGVVDGRSLPVTSGNSRIAVWQGDITRLAAEQGLRSIAFCCISTGEVHFPNREAAEIAVKTVAEFLRRDTSIEKVIFNVFKDLDAQIYRRLLG